MPHISFLFRRGFRGFSMDLLGNGSTPASKSVSQLQQLHGGLPTWQRSSLFYLPPLLPGILHYSSSFPLLYFRISMSNSSKTVWIFIGIAMDLSREQLGEDEILLALSLPPISQSFQCPLIKFYKCFHISLTHLLLFIPRSLIIFIPILNAVFRMFSNFCWYRKKQKICIYWP